MSTFRDLRLATGASQAAFARRLGIPVESLRAWDSGRRKPPSDVLEAAQRLAQVGSLNQPLPLRVLGDLLGVSVYRLREAARDGRLAVVYTNQVAFGRPVPKATVGAGEAYKRLYFGKRARWRTGQLAPIVLATVPRDFDQQLRELRARLRMSQVQLASAIGAAGRAVVYQWESRKRTPSEFLWFKILAVARSRSAHR